jgi:hypothetical protein
MRYRMVQIGVDKDGRQRWRGTGFCQEPGGMTFIGDERIGWVGRIFRWFAAK